MSAATVTDWDRDGKLDLLIVSSRVMFAKGNGDLTFDLKEPLKVHGELITLHDGSVNVVDWDGDGTNDLILSTEQSEVRFYRGRPSVSGAVNLESPVTLLAPSPTGRRVFKDADSMELDYPLPGRRPRVAVVDWNLDGKLDLLLGDLLNMEIVPRLTSEQQALRERLLARYQELMARQRQFLEAAAKKLGFAISSQMTAEQYERWVEAMVEIRANEEYKRNGQEMEALGRDLAPLTGKIVNYGFVWVYLRKEGLAGALQLRTSDILRRL